MIIVCGVIPARSTEAVQEKSPVHEDTSVGVVTSADAGISLGEKDTTPVRKHTPVLKYNPYFAGIGSAVIPGAGLIYGKEYVRGGLVLAAEAGLGYYSWFWYDQSRQTYKGIDSMTLLSRQNAGITRIDSMLNRRDTISVSTQYAMKSDSVRHEYNKQRTGFTQGFCWAMGCYLYGIAASVDKSGYFYNTEKRNPVMAGWLSAIPFLALGQVYNGKVSKAGAIWMTQSSMALIAWNNHRLMREAEINIDRYREPSSLEQAVARKTPVLAAYWNSERNEAFRNRNTWMWYSLFFYLYNVFDAVVDAHLHDYDARMKLEPDLNPDLKSVGMRATVTY